jgi:hypothetical protein
VAQQQALYAQGRYKPGKIVTNCDGLIKVSNHQPKDDGYGYAVDVAWVIDNRVTWEGPWPRLGVLATAHVFVKPGVEEKEIFKAYRQSYRDEPFVRIVKERTGVYRTLEDFLPEKGNRISVEDVADFLITELTARKHLQKRVGAGY